ncbi:cysteine desulfurase-like protein [Christiangramia sp. OXR-203]|jgi:cysteine desulfurase family protein (TIGR01976 family)|uniref:cysteine desulfurase-like protein n=1 Tax=Christiangramia sp. OXR-203 TaxID=3100176 RepID=UPI002AC8CC23|nr:cysteine desulfurase-like protein [Christiangramia sp. OXR-203]WPY98569.1 cysteine desulfurase-like protein [Christiangramia sp. OXR-203]
MMDINFVREQFPALERDFVFMDNAGGSQVLKQVTNKITDYLLHSNVQLGASYAVSQEAGDRLKSSTEVVSELINASRPEEIVIGSSTTMLMRILSLSISKNWEKGDEIIVTNTDHEANVSPWTDLEKSGFKVKIWHVNPESLELDTKDLEHLLTEKTKLVAVTHASNVLGTINPVKQYAEIVHKAGALICVDGVAYAPHRKVDVQDLDADFYTFSWYKTYGPHLAMMYGKYDLLRELESINHYFIDKDAVPYKLQPGNFNFELTYAVSGITDYYTELHDHHFDGKDLQFKEKLNKTYELISAHEEKLATRLLDYLNSISEIKIIGQTSAAAEKRVPTISFVHQNFRSNDIVEAVDPHNIGIRFGDFYAKKLIHDLQLEDKNGVVRVSLVHYNTLEEVDKLIEVFKTIFKS